MLTLQAAKIIGINACIEKIGLDFVRTHRISSASAYGETDGKVFCFVGVDETPHDSAGSGAIILDSTSAFQYKVSCTVALEDGAIKFTDCVLPSL